MKVTSELVDWQVSEGEIEDAPELHWPVEFSEEIQDYVGNLWTTVTRSDKSQLQIVLEQQDGRLQLRIYAVTPEGESAIEEAIVNLNVNPDYSVDVLQLNGRVINLQTSRFRD